MFHLKISHHPTGRDTAQRANKCPTLDENLSNQVLKYLMKQGLLSLGDGMIWFCTVNETPCADPHAGYRGGWRRETYGYPIMCA